MAWRVQCFDSDTVAELPRLAVGRRLSDGLAVLAANDGQLAQGFELDFVNGEIYMSFLTGRASYNSVISTSVVPVTIAHRQLVYCYLMIMTRNTNWWVLIIALSLILPASFSAVKTGTTLSSSLIGHSSQLVVVNLLLRVRRVDNCRLLCRLVGD